MDVELRRSKALHLLADGLKGSKPITNQLPRPCIPTVP